MTLHRYGLYEGDRRKTDALVVLEAHRDLTVLRGRRALLTALLAVGQASADDVRDALDVPDGIDPVCLGAVPGALARAGIIRRVGYTPTCRPDAHARPVSVWMLADRAAAERWLRDHPDRPDPEPDQANLPATERQGLLFPPTTNEPTPAAGTAGAGMEV